MLQLQTRSKYLQCEGHREWLDIKQGGLSGQARTKKALVPPSITVWHSVLPVSNEQVWSGGWGASVGSLHVVLRCYLQVRASVRGSSCGNVLVLAGKELLFFLVAAIVLRFGFRIRRMLITH